MKNIIKQKGENRIMTRARRKLSKTIKSGVKRERKLLSDSSCYLKDKRVRELTNSYRDIRIPLSFRSVFRLSVFCVCFV